MAEGVRTVETLLESGIELSGLLSAGDARADPRRRAVLDRALARGVPVLELSEPEFASAADTEAPQGVLAIAAIPRRAVPSLAASGTRILVLDALQDPGNVGTVIRTAAAMDVRATVALEGTVDLWNAKVVRSSMGALFTHHAMSMSWASLNEWLAANAVPCWAADTNGAALEAITRPLPDALALVVSNEGAGLSPHVAAHIGRRVAIRMAPGVESLNVAVATGILLHALRDSYSIP